MRLVAICCAVACALGGIVRADKRGDAERYFAYGEKAYRAQSFGAAAANFERAYAALALPEIAFSAAQAHRRQYRVDHDPKHVKRAIELYNKYLEAFKEGHRVADAADALEELDRELAKLVRAGAKMDGLVDKPRTWVGIDVSFGADETRHAMHEVADAPATQGGAASAWIDGKQVKLFEEVDVKPGEHELRAEADGYVASRKIVAIGDGQGQLFTLELAPKPARVAIRAERGTQIALDGRAQGAAPMPPLDVPAGKHVLGFAHLGRVPVVRELVVRRGQELALDGKLAMTTRRRVVPWIVGTASGLAVVAAVSGIAAAVLTHDAWVLERRFNAGNAQPSDLASYHDDQQWRDWSRATAIGTGVTAVLLGGLAALLFYTDNPSPERARVMPAVAPGGVGVSLTGRF